MTSDYARQARGRTGRMMQRQKKGDARRPFLRFALRKLSVPCDGAD